MRTFYEFCESTPGWMLYNKFSNALEQLQRSRFFRGRQVNVKNLNLSIQQLKDVFGNDLKELISLGIVVPRTTNDQDNPVDDNPFGRSTGSYTLVAPK